MVSYRYNAITNRKEICMNYKMFFVTSVMGLTTVACLAKDILSLNNQNAINDAIKSNEMVIIKYGAKWCGPCNKMDAILPSLAKENTKILFVKVDIDELTVEGINSVPTFVFYFNGKEVKRFTGSKSPASFKNIINEVFVCCDKKNK